MKATKTIGSVFKRLDALNEFERQPVTKDKLHSGLYFAGAFAGEHVAATEFVIGALFVSTGARAFDVIVGLLLGNLLAVLSWTLICAPIAVQTRLTLYWYLRQIAGPGLMAVYNVINAVLYCVLGGAMITVAASAVRIPFGIPDQTKWYPEDVRFVLVVLGIGAVVVVLAILGFKRLAQFSAVCSPWMLLMFVAGAIVTLPVLGDINSWAGFWAVANQQIWKGPQPGQAGAIGFWHIVAFAWVCNQGMHLGLTDMALLRYAKRASYGLYSACGMYLGHYLAWICAGIMGAAAVVVLGRPLVSTGNLPGLDSGSVAHAALGAIGVLTVVIAGWTTANPMLYRAGLALQVITPGWPRWLVTLIAGVITTITACSPFVFTKMLDFAALYGLIIMPMGVIVLVEHWLFPRIGFNPFWTSRKGNLLNWPALAAWGVSLAIGIAGWQAGVIHLFFLFAPVWILTAVLYVALAAVAGARDPLPDLAQSVVSRTDLRPFAAAASANVDPPGRNRTLYYLSGAVASVCLVLCLLLPLWVWRSESGDYARQLEIVKNLLLWTTLVYFIAGVIWMDQWEKGKAASPA